MTTSSEKYQRHYDRLIERARLRVLNGYKERHHVVPTCMGGGADPSNIVELTGEEHYVAHQLLVRIHPNVKGLIYAAAMMSRCSPSNKAYGWLRKRFAEAQRGNKYSLGKYHSEETKAKLSALYKGKKRGPLGPRNGPTKPRANGSTRTGIPLSEETRARISAALRGKPCPLLRKPKSEATRAKMSTAQMGNKKSLGLIRGPQSAEHIAKRMASRKAKKAERPVR